VKSYR